MLSRPGCRYSSPTGRESRAPAWALAGDEKVRDPIAGVESLAFSPDGRLLAWGSTDATVKVWEAATREIRTLRGHTSWLMCVAFSPDGRQIASSSLDKTVKIWHVPFGPEASREALEGPGPSPKDRP
jgi:WD40 repeat protein